MTQETEKRALKLLQGYIWHPREAVIDLAVYLPRTLEPAIRVIWDKMPQAPFTFFDDGTLSATQQFYQFTVITIVEDEKEAAKLVPAVAETLQAKLNTTPAGVGWQISEDLRDV
jgi:hypothetical protein